MNGHRGVWVSAGVLVFAVLCMCGIGALYVSSQINDNNRKWCNTLVLVNSADQQTPPTGTYGQKLAADFRQLKDSFGCRS